MPTQAQLWPHQGTQQHPYPPLSAMQRGTFTPPDWLMGWGWDGEHRAAAGEMHVVLQAPNHPAPGAPGQRGSTPRLIARACRRTEPALRTCKYGGRAVEIWVESWTEAPSTLPVNLHCCSHNGRKRDAEVLMWLSKSMTETVTEPVDTLISVVVLQLQDYQYMREIYIHVQCFLFTVMHI